MPILNRMNNARKHIQFMIDSKQNFLLTSSNYTTSIETELEKIKYVANMQSMRAFACFSKIKKDVSDKKIPDTKKDDLIYFHHDFKSNLYIEKVCNIDLKAAYATILHNDGYITKDTYKYLLSSTKNDRLSSVGMLASRKEHFDFVEGSPTTHNEEIAETAPFFYYAVERTYDVMSNLKAIVGKSYLYQWVDGIYFLPDKNLKKKCINYLKTQNYKYSIDMLDSFEVSIKRDHVLVTFKKEGKRKLFNLPTPQTEFKRIIIDSILLMNKKANKIINTKLVHARKQRQKQKLKKKKK